MTAPRLKGRVNPAKSHAVADAAVVYVVILQTAGGLLILGGFATFLIVAFLFVFLDDA